jgi:hypothetical protein
MRIDIDIIFGIACLGDMTRAWQIEYKGAWYHLLSRGNEHRGILTAESEPEVKSQI